MNFKSPHFKRAVILIVAVLLCVFLLRQLQGPSSNQSATSVPYSDFTKLVESGLVEKVSLSSATGQIDAVLAVEPVVVATPSDQANVDPPAPELSNQGKPSLEVPAPATVPAPDTPTTATPPGAIIPLPPPTTGRQVTTFVPPAAIGEVMTMIAERSPKTVVEIKAPVKPSPWGSILFYMVLLLPVVLLIMIYMSSRRGMPGSPADRAAEFGKIKSSMVDPQSNSVRFEDVAGCDEAKLEVAEVVEFLKRPEDFERVGAKGPRGVLMVGPPGTGKTLLAKAIAGEAGVPFFTQSGSDFVEMFVGVGASRVRSLFDIVKQHAPAIIFIDEIDAVGKARSNGGMPGGANDEREGTLNQLLVQMDGFDTNAGIVVIAATNRADTLDPALRRPGRFDRQVYVPLPDRDGREKILRLHAKKVPVANEVDWQRVARGTPGFSGADLANLVNEAALHAARKRAAMVTPADLEEARDKIILGAERRGMSMGEHARKVIAYHEAGHALVGHFTDHTDPVHKITIVPRGGALGVTMSLPRDDNYNQNSERLRAEIAVLLGGRAAEEVALGNASVGASNDFHRATEIARRMVGVWGMSDLGTVSVHREQGEGGWNPSPWSEHWKRQVDDRAAQLLRDGYEQARNVMLEHREALEKVAKELLDNETVDADRFVELVGPSPFGNDPVATS